MTLSLHKDGFVPIMKRTVPQDFYQPSDILVGSCLLVLPQSVSSNVFYEEDNEVQRNTQMFLPQCVAHAPAIDAE